MVVGGPETVAHGGEDGHETAKAWDLGEMFVCFVLCGGLGRRKGDRPFSSVIRSARWRALRGALAGEGEGRRGGGGGGGTLSWRSGLCLMLGVWLVFLDLEDGSVRVLDGVWLDSGGRPTCLRRGCRFLIRGAIGRV